MNISRLLPAAALAALVFIASAHARIDRVVEKTFAVQPGTNLKVATSGGDITVLTGPVGQVTVVAKQRFQRASTEAEADKAAENLTLTLEQTGNDVSAIAKLESRSWGWRGSPVTVSFVVTVPERANLSLGTSGGDITVGDVVGTVEARTSGGDIKLAVIDGSVKAATSGGDVALAGATGDVVLSTSGGDIRSGKVGGKARLSTSGGDIAVTDVSGAVEADTSGGDVEVALSGAPVGECSLSTSGGDVAVSLPKSAAFQLDARTSGGSVKAPGLTLAVDGGTLGKKNVRGTANGGGALLKLRSSGGDITVTGR